MDYILTDLVSSLCPLIGIGMGIRSFYQYLHREYDWCPLNDGRDVPAFALVSMIAVLVSGIASAIVLSFNLHVRLLGMFIPDLVNGFREVTLLSYFYDILIGCLLESLIAIISWKTCEKLVIADVI